MQKNVKIKQYSKNFLKVDSAKLQGFHVTV